MDPRYRDMGKCLEPITDLVTHLDIGRGGTACARFGLHWTGGGQQTVGFLRFLPSFLRFLRTGPHCGLADRPRERPPAWS